MISWFVVHTQALKEKIAEQHLLAQGFEVYMPRFKKTRRHARKVEEVIVPLFSRYLFVGMDLDTTPWRCVNGTRGVAYLLTIEGHPATVPSHIVNSLKAQENLEGLVPVNSLSVFTNGDKVRILEGTFKDQIATFEMLDDKQRIHVLLAFMGREINISLPVYAVDAA